MEAREGGQEKGMHDFDFWMGRWTIHNRRLRKRLAGSTDWEEFEATCAARPLLGGLGNEDEFRAFLDGEFIGMSFRFFDPKTNRWAIYWADNRRGVLDPPVFGSFEGDVGVFEGTDTFEGRSIRVRFTWSRVTTATPRWEQAFSPDDGRTWETNWVMDMRREESPSLERVKHLGDLPVVELRRYTLVEGQQGPFARCFESYFPEAHEQLGALFFGQFFERGRPSSFTMLRGFRDMDARASVCGAFYYGPLWKEHAAAINDRLVAWDNVLLLQPLRAERGVSVLPAVDPVEEPGGARGIVVAHVFAVGKEKVQAFARLAEPTFARFRTAGAREAGVLVTRDEPNNFPRLPVRTDGPFLVWLGIVADEKGLEAVTRVAQSEESSFAASGLLRSAPEWVVLEPTPRSRLRWLPEWGV
jgi:NIPSNAP protein